MEAYEIKLSQTLSRELAAPLSRLIQDYPVTRASLLSLHDAKVALYPHVFAEPWFSV